MVNKVFIPLFGLAIGASLLSGCTKMENFSTDKVLDDVTTTKDTAKIKITTNIHNVFAIPNHSCITLDEHKVKKVNTTFSRSITDDWAMWGKTESLLIKEYPEKTIGMNSISLEHASELKRILPNNVKSYSSYEYEVEANKPITFFIKTTKGTGLFAYLALFAKDSEELFSLSSSFIPEKGREYQLFVTLGESSSLISPSQRKTTYEYSFNLFDISQGTLNNQNKLMSKVNPCRKVK
ncbi:hypothetical protein [Actinobacillus equuli]|uniref:Lipoprotein n=1 Tax=Actinobacillus equuli TaxID=718 RepID=A0AAX3FM97_ACTEU|nr:hypothetical protein [Actinobacillus equuli]AIZ79863.1 hypothetical protein ACEE_08830 [Actinobacillus equuli subsp. equuli]WGE43978.1 hypothetical protein NYR65_08720 [Actinobacillus equuli subsp. equuli]VEE90806.1 Uncharacterised protein [Actinobacillus equuli]